MIYAVIFAVAMCDFLFLYNLTKFAYWLSVVSTDRSGYKLYNKKLQLSAIYAAIFFSLSAASAAIIRAWEMGVLE